MYSGGERETSQNRGKVKQSKVQRYPWWKNCSRVLRTSYCGDGSPSNRTMTLSTEPRQCRSGIGTSLWMSLSGPARDRTWTRSNISGVTWNRLSPSNLTEHERICREEWEELPKYRCAKPVASKFLNECDISFFYVLANISENLFLLCYYRVLCVD